LPRTILQRRRQSRAAFPLLAFLQLRYRQMIQVHGVFRVLSQAEYADTLGLI